MSKIELDHVPAKAGSGYPPPYAAEMAGRSSLRLGDAGGLTQFGVNITILQPGAKSSMRHWHESEDEFVMVTQGSCTLVQDDGGTILHTGDCAAFRAGVPNGHCLINHTETEARFLVVGARPLRDVARYPDIDMMATREGGTVTFAHRDGSPFAQDGLPSEAGPQPRSGPKAGI